MSIVCKKSSKPLSASKIQIEGVTVFLVKDIWAVQFLEAGYVARQVIYDSESRIKNVDKLIQQPICRNKGEIDL